MMRPGGTVKYGSICSGIESASVAWEPLGMQPTWFSEIEPFPSAVLDHRYPHVPNLGDMRALPSMIATGLVPAPDVLVGGTPCQAFSVAGKREGLDDERGSLTLKFVEIADEIDKQRDEPCVIVWENVPGVLSSKDNAFGCFLAALAGEDNELQPGPLPAIGKSSRVWRWSAKDGRHIAKWSKSGCVYGPQRAIAWRILDAQYFGVAQRRRRVFVVASAREGFDPTAVLFEREGVRRDTPPSRETREEIATCPTLRAGGNSTGGDRPPGTDVDTVESLQIISRTDDVSRQDYETERLVAHTLLGKSNLSHGESLDTYLPIPDKATRHAGRRGDGKRQDGSGNGLGIGKESDPMFTLTTGDKHAVAIPINTQMALRGAETSNSPREGIGVGKEGDPAFTLQAAHHHAVAATISSLIPEEQQGRRIQSSQGVAPTLMSNPNGGMKLEPVFHQMAVRRLTPIECERLQGFEDNYTLIPTAKARKIEADYFEYLRQSNPSLAEEQARRLAADGPRYKALGNSKAVPVVRWIGGRLLAHIAELHQPISSPAA